MEQKESYIAMQTKLLATENYAKLVRHEGVPSRLVYADFYSDSDLYWKAQRGYMLEVAAPAGEKINVYQLDPATKQPASPDIIAQESIVRASELRVGVGALAAYAWYIDPSNLQIFPYHESLWTHLVKPARSPIVGEHNHVPGQGRLSLDGLAAVLYGAKQL